MTTAPTQPRAFQGSFDDLGEPLYETVFVVVDLETTGGSSDTNEITEIGAVKVRGGEVLGEFQTFVSCDRPVPHFITQLTGITNEMLVGQPSPGEAMASFLEFLGDGVLVAHNARFDVSFLRATCARNHYEWPNNEVLDTVALARTVIGKDEAPNHKLSTLAKLFATTVTPDHRALADARATVDVLHALLERHAARGVTHRSDLATATAKVPDAVRRKRTLADSLPTEPGVYIFRDESGTALYVGRSHNIRSRVRQYFTGHDTRRNMTTMVARAHQVDAVPCATELEAQLRELRLIHALTPSYNKRSTRQMRAYWLTLRDDSDTPVHREPFKSNIITPHLGPFQSSRAADGLRQLLLDTFGYSPAVRGIRPEPPRLSGLADVFYGAVRPVTQSLLARLSTLSDQERFEQAAAVRDQLKQLLRASQQAHYHALLVESQDVVMVRHVAHRDVWEVDLIRRCRHVASATVPHQVAVAAVIPSLRITADAQDPAVATAEELSMVCSVLSDPDTFIWDGDQLKAVPEPVAGLILKELF